MLLSRTQAILTLESGPEIIKIADRALRAAGANGKLPTPIEDLILAAKVVEDKDTEGTVRRFLSSLSESSRSLFHSTFQKVRGIADLRQRAVYVPADTAPRQRFAKGHELGHQIIPWHRIGADRVPAFYKDNDYTLSPFVTDLFDIEANFFSSEVIFQGKRFAERVRDYKPSFDAVFLLSDLHGASRQATLRRFVEEQDEILASISYLPSHYDRADGFPVLRAPRLIGSHGFNVRYACIRLPAQLLPHHPWAEARNSQELCSGEIDLDCDGPSVRFEWQAWWNNYSLLILLRRRPLLAMVSRLFQQ
jgi:hypothetical protein